MQRLFSRVYFVKNSYAECSHCADAVLSLSNNATVVGEVAAPLVDFAARWAQSPSDYDFIISATLNAEWASQHHPVLSRANHGHFVYTRYRRWEPEGKIVRCCQNCSEGVTMKDRNTNTVRFICEGCGLRCSVQKSLTDLDKSTPLGKRSFVKVDFPRPQYPTPNWELPPTTATVARPGPRINPGTAARRNPGLAPARTQKGLVPPESIVRASSLPLPPVPTTSTGPSTSSTGLTIRLPGRENPLPALSRSRSTSSVAGPSTPSSSRLPPSDSIVQDEVRKRPTKTKEPSKSAKRQKRK